MQPKSLRNAVLDLAREHYSTEAEFLWARTPTYGILRHPNGKWFAAIMDIPKSKIGLPGDGLIDVLNVQVDPAMSGSLRQRPGIFPGYHMNKEKWITVLLDGTGRILTAVALCIIPTAYSLWLLRYDRTKSHGDI